MENINPNEQQSQSQCQQILAYLQNGGRITSLSALNLFGCMRLSARILNLKEQGHVIGSQFIHDQNTGKKYKEYFLGGCGE
ncbi:hypothetical protein A1D22_05915 [Pasteurellaceae bacterium LFhippo2]|nr:hypothetical protein [Pasteurellaceae bacterium LFhippo2]